MKWLEGIVFFADADEFDRLAGDLADGERRAAASIAVHLGENDAGERKFFVEFVGGANGVLPGHGVGDEENLRRIQQLFQRLHLVHQFVVDVQTSGGVDDQHVAAGNDGFAAGFFYQTLDCLCELLGRRRFADIAFVNLRFDGLRDNFQLLASGGTVHVDRNQ